MTRMHKCRISWAVMAVGIMAAVLIMPPGQVLGEDLPVTQSVLTADGKKAEVHEGQRLVFFDGVGSDASIVARVDVSDCRVVPSGQGKFVGVHSRDASVPRPVVIYSSAGKEVFRFDSEAGWGLLAVSDTNGLVALGKQGTLEPELPRVMLCDSVGKVLRRFDSADHAVRITFSRDGVPFVYGRDVKEQRSFVSRLSATGQTSATYTFPDTKTDIFEVKSSVGENSVVILTGQRADPGARPNLTRALTVWYPARGEVLPILISPTGEDIIRTGIAVSPDGSHMAICLADMTTAVIRSADGLVVYKVGLEGTEAGGAKMVGLWRTVVRNDASAVALGKWDGSPDGLLGYGSLTKTGAIRSSATIGPFTPLHADVQHLPGRKIGIMTRGADRPSQTVVRTIEVVSE